MRTIPYQKVWSRTWYPSTLNEYVLPFCCWSSMCLLSDVGWEGAVSCCGCGFTSACFGGGAGAGACDRSSLTSVPLPVVQAPPMIINRWSKTISMQVKTMRNSAHLLLSNCRGVRTGYIVSCVARGVPFVFVDYYRGLYMYWPKGKPGRALFISIVCGSHGVPIATTSHITKDPAGPGNMDMHYSRAFKLGRHGQELSLTIRGR